MVVGGVQPCHSQKLRSLRTSETSLCASVSLLFFSFPAAASPPSPPPSLFYFIFLKKAQFILFAEERLTPICHTEIMQMTKRGAGADSEARGLMDDAAGGGHPAAGHSLSAHLTGALWENNWLSSVVSSPPPPIPPPPRRHHANAS